MEGFNANDFLQKYWNKFELDNHYVIKANDLIQDWPKYEDLKIIVIGSSDVDPDVFKSSGAFVGELKDENNLPKSVDYLANVLVQNMKLKLDYHSHHSKNAHGILFLNVCLTPDHCDSETALISVKFINSILWEKQKVKNILLIIDMRLEKHRHFSENVDQNWAFLNKVDDAYCINDNGYHKFLKWKHPGYWGSGDIINYGEELNKLRDEFPEIYSIYKIEPDCNLFDISLYTYTLMYFI